MPNNLLANTPFAGTAGVTVAFTDAGITTDNIDTIYEAGSPIKSYKPSRLINPITSFTKGKGYYIIPKADFDLNFIFLSPNIMQTLSDAATIIFDLTKGTSAKVAIGASRNITISNAIEGDTGILTVTHTVANTTLALPGKLADGFAWSTGTGEVTVLGFIYESGGFRWFSEPFTT